MKKLLFIICILLISIPAFSTTITIGIIGQSNGGQMTCNYVPFPGSTTYTDGCGTATANANVYRWNGSAWVFPGTGSGSDSAGLVALGNAINNATGWTVHMINVSFGSSSIFQEMNPAPGWWWNSNNTPSTDAQTGISGNSYASAKAKVVAATGGSLDVIVLMNDESEGLRVYPSTCPSSICTPTPPANPNIWTSSWYISKVAAFWSQLQSDFGASLLIQSQLATTSNEGSEPTPYNFDASWSNVREFNKAAVTSYGGHTYIGDCTVNFTLGSYGIHWTAAGYAKAGQMLAQTILYDKGYVSWYKGPTITGLNAVDSTHTDILIQHSGGNDFTPTSSITGFTETCGGSALTISAAVRQTASSIRLTHGACSGTRVATYMYGIYPNVAGVVDNSTLTYPLEPNINITQVSPHHPQQYNIGLGRIH
jgi:hypothetical protein